MNETCRFTAGVASDELEGGDGALGEGRADGVPARPRWLGPGVWGKRTSAEAGVPTFRVKRRQRLGSRWATEAGFRMKRR